MWFGLAWLPAVREKQSFGLIWLKWATHKSTVLNKTVAHARLALDEFLINFWHFFPTTWCFLFQPATQKAIARCRGGEGDRGSPANQFLYFIIRQLQQTCQKLIQNVANRKGTAHSSVTIKQHKLIMAMLFTVHKLKVLYYKLYSYNFNLNLNKHVKERSSKLASKLFIIIILG